MKPQMQRIKKEELSTQKEIDLIADYQSGSETAEYSLVQLFFKYSPLISRIASVVSSGGGWASKKDYISFGKIGFFDALKRYNPNNESSTKFSEYSYDRILGEIIDGARLEIPNELGPKKSYGKIMRAIDRYFTENGKYPSLDELSKITKCPIKTLENTKRPWCRKGLMERIAQDHHLTYSDIITYEYQKDPSEEISLDTKGYLHNLFNSAYEEGELTERQATLFSLTYTIDEPMPPVQVARIFNITDSAVVHSNKIVFKKLKNRAIKEGYTLDDFI